MRGEGYQPPAFIFDVLDFFFGNQRLKVFVENLAFFIGQILETFERGVEQFFGFKIDADFVQTRFEGVAAGEFSQGQAVGGPTHRLGTHDLVGFAMLQHAVLMNAGFVRKRIGTHHRLVGLHGIAGNPRHQLGCRDDLRGINAGVADENILPRAHCHDDFFE